ncbi:MAG: helix-turn-helix domain-containing protein [Clostridia bacterium]|nr:helix-turn-helix domain-containing protein [Clostridia bacterium]
MEIFKEKHEHDVTCHVKDATKWDHYFHWHENFEILRIINKSSKFLIDGQSVEADPGDIVVINRRSVHLFMIEDTDVKILIMQFPVKSLLALEAGLPNIKTHITKEELHAIPEVERLVDACIDRITKEAPLDVGVKNPYLFSLVNCLYFTLAKHFPSVADSRSGASRLFFDAVDYINEHFTDEDITVESVAKQLYVSREKISGEFLKYSGVSLKNYICSLRIKKVNLLLDEGFDIGTAAMKCGFNNLRTFNYTYKRVVGITPTEYLNSRKSTNSNQ